MVFSSIVFLYLFLPVLLLCYFGVPATCRSGRNGVLLAFSLVFYAYGGPKFLGLMLASITVNYLGGRLVGGARGKVWMWVAVGANLGLLGWFKYAGFLATSLQSVLPGLPIPQVVLPIGISFFTFQGLSYVLDVYRKEAESQKNPLHVALYIALFPQLVAGPIVRYTTVSHEIQGRRETLEDFAQGGVRFLWGLGKKMVLANALGGLADEVYATASFNMTTALAWLGAVAYTGQIYFDFSAYSDMAIGLGRMFGFHFLENFNYPYISKSITEFWRRWHISLSSWFRDYVYIPLGGNRTGVLGHIRNLIIVWFLTGMWHGAAWTFIAWGLYFCLLLLGEKYLWGRVLEKLPGWLQHGYALILVIGSWVLFRSPTMEFAQVMFSAMTGSATLGLSDERTVYYLLTYGWALLLAIPASTPMVPWVVERLGRWDHKVGRFLLAYGGMGVGFVLYAYAFLQLVSASFNPFIYFRF